MTRVNHRESNIVRIILFCIILRYILLTNKYKKYVVCHIYLHCMYCSNSQGVRNYHGDFYLYACIGIFIQIYV